MKFNIGEATSSWGKMAKLEVFYQEICPSTNDLAKENSIQSQNIGLITTDHQTQGRGRTTNSWIDESGNALLCSWLFPLPTPPKPVTTVRIGVAITTALKSTWPFLNFSLKAPNDIFLDGKKMGGILVENIQQGSHNKLIVGIGLNIFSQPPSVEANNLTSALKLSNQNEKYNGEGSLTPVVWNQFLDRLLLELTLAVSKAENLLTPYEQETALFFLNQRLDLNEKIIFISSEGTLRTSKKTIAWHEL